ncbi:DASH family cryptochrome [Tenacibaculum soleae]|uniref:DASH family cryptochrome n=1 Tax=Tenacibaculum soleae TaxID=447689 RepID=UPI0026E28782|nr:DASH family cryptochrome [Tenacibaculum soleae]MDO6744437.1 DASH family cryptochrome [Tenacibaculum soleae]
MQEKQECTLVWFRNDLRINNNELLKKAIATQKNIIAIYIFNDVLFEKQYSFVRTGKFRTSFLIETLIELEENLAIYNIPLLVLFKSIICEFKKLKSRFLVKNIVFQEDSTFDERKIEKEVLKEFSEETQVLKVSNQYLYNPSQIDAVFKNGIPKSFSSFRKIVEKKLKVEKNVIYQIPEQKRLCASNLKFPKTIHFKTPSFSAFTFKGGESEALKRIKSYFFKTEAVLNYRQTRNQLLGANYSTKLSSWLANGSVSAKTIYWELKGFEESVGKNDSTYWVYLELLWREFFKHTARFQGVKIFALGGIQDKEILNPTKDALLIQSWIDGKTASDFVNANMIELKYTGFMSNRGRQNVASYFIHELNQDWRVGAAYFESMLLDYNPHSNYGNWMYIAGVGNSAQQKKFDVVWQANTYDVNREFTDKWINFR